MKNQWVKRISSILVLAAALVACSKSDESQLIPLGTPSAMDIVKPPLESAPSVVSATTSTTSTTTVSTLREEIAKLEQSGQVVPLDRSDSLLGADLDNNGVRDDIDSYIKTLNLPSAQSRAALQKAKALQMTLGVDVTDKTAMQKVGDIQMASAKCFVRVFADSPAERQISQALESKTANTKIRVTKYLAYNSASSGSVTTLPSGDTCEK